MEVFNDRSARIEQAERIKELEHLALVDELTACPTAGTSTTISVTDWPSFSGTADLSGFS